MNLNACFSSLSVMILSSSITSFSSSDNAHFFISSMSHPQIEMLSLKQVSEQVYPNTN